MKLDKWDKALIFCLPIAILEVVITCIFYGPRITIKTFISTAILALICSIVMYLLDNWKKEDKNG